MPETLTMFPWRKAPVAQVEASKAAPSALVHLAWTGTSVLVLFGISAIFGHVWANNEMLSKVVTLGAWLGWLISVQKLQIFPLRDRPTGATGFFATFLGYSAGITAFQIWFHLFRGAQDIVGNVLVGVLLGLLRLEKRRR